jgi:hypothetical protein
MKNLEGQAMDWKTLLAKEYVAHSHEERPHQGTGNVILFPSVRPEQNREGLICCHERFGGLLKCYECEAA